MSVVMVQTYLFYVAYGAVTLALVALSVWAVRPSAG